MGKYLLKRLGQMVLVVIVVAFFTFLMVNMIPGDIVYIVAGTDEMDQTMYDTIYYELGLDIPVFQRFLVWGWNALHLDFGKSYTMNMPVFDVIASRLPFTIYLSVLSMLVSVPIGIVLGIVCAVNRRTKIDTTITLISNTLNSLPQFWVGIVLLYLLSLKLKWLPTLGFDFPWNIGFGKHIKLLIMPLTCLSLGGIAGFTRQTRSSMLEVLRADYLRTARAKGVPEQRVIRKHALSNAWIPILTTLGGAIAGAVSGSAVIEMVFSFPGIGRMLVEAINARDVTTTMGCVVLTTTFYVLMQLAVDLMYAFVDPRIKSLYSNTSRKRRLVA